MILLTIPNGEGRHHSAVKNSALLRGIHSRNNGDFYCLNHFLLFRTKKLESQKRVSENKDFCGVVMPSQEAKILQFDQYQKFDKTPSFIYGDLESLIKNG